MRWAWPLLAALVAVTSACGKAVDIGSVRDVTAPTFATPPSRPGDSPQLAAVPIRDTNGIEPSRRSAEASQLPAALDALTTARPSVTNLTRLSIYDRSIHFAFINPSHAGQAITAVYYLPDGELRIHDPTFNDDGSYPIASIQPQVPARLVRDLEARFPLTRVTTIDLRVSLSYGFGLAWYVDLEDARGTVAIVYADLDGTIIAVDKR